MVNQKILEVAEKEKLSSGWINGLGAISNIEIGYWEIEEKVYVKKQFDADYELLSLSFANINAIEKNMIKNKLFINKSYGLNFYPSIFR